MKLNWSSMLCVGLVSALAFSSTSVMAQRKRPNTKVKTAETLSEPKPIKGSNANTLATKNEINSMVPNDGSQKYKYTYESVAGDPLGVKIYTLANGLKVYMSVYKDAPRIQTYIATRAGSKNDPSDATGLAHYLEHMLFKGTSKIGTLDWAKEKVLLQKISDLYEQRRGEKDPEKRKELYKQIDAASQEASKLVAANEYDKLMSSLGAQGTNAFTSLDQTAYVNDIPSNELEKWMVIESERMSELTLRLFHTELEAVYEEFNIGQDNDGRKVYKNLMENLFPSHTYGTQTTIGTGEHLKNPSMVKIHEFFSKYYVPNNMAIILSGDLDPDKTVAMVEKYFGKWQRKPLETWQIKPQPAITAPIEKEVFGQEKASLRIGYRFEGAASKDPMYLELLDAVLNNGQAGIIDLNLLQKQVVLKANSGMWGMHDYSMFMLDGTPREGQKLEEVRDLLLTQIEEVKKGNFPDWLIPAAVKFLKLNAIKQHESNGGRAGDMLNAFILGEKWEDVVKKFDEMSKITKQDLVNFVNQRFAKNYVVIFKRQGEDKEVYKVEKPTITPIPVNRTDKSAFLQSFEKINSMPMKAEFLDFKRDIQTTKLKSGVQFDYIKNPDNPTFDLYYSFDMGKNHDAILPIAIKLLPYLGTDKYTGEQLQQEFFKLGLSFNVYSSEDRCYVSLSGLEESFTEGVKLFEHILANVKPDQKALDNVVADLLKQRNDALKDKRTILRSGMVSYAKYGDKNPFTDIVSEADLKALKADDLAKKIKELTSYQHTAFYYGRLPKDAAAAILQTEHKVPASLKAIPAEKKYSEQNINENSVIFVNFPMVQAEILMLSKGNNFNLQERLMSDYYNDYFGSGLSSIIFQEIRESKALAYSTYAYYGSPQYADRAHYFQAYVGTQADKLKEAVTAVRTIVEDMPVSPAQVDNARNSLIKKLETERITKSDIYWTYQNARKLGLDRDIRIEQYDIMKKATKEDLLKFQKEHVKGRKYTYLVLGDKTKVDMEFLKTIGTVKELQLKDIFGYGTP